MSDKHMNPNYLEDKKEQVRYWSKIGALLLTLLSNIIRLQKGKSLFDEENWTENWNQASWPAKVFIIGILVALALISYHLNYYLISSIFWPEPLSLFNCLLLIPCGIGTLLEVRKLGKLLLEK